MRRNVIIYSLVILVIISVSFLAGMNYGGYISAQNSIDRNLQILLQAYNIITNNYVEKVDGKNISYKGIEGMLSSLNDPYSYFMKPEDYKAMGEEFQGSFEGIGIEIGMNDKKQIVVISPIDDTPAQKAGLKTGDIILKVDDKSTEGMNLDQVSRLIRGPAGTKVRLTIQREEEPKPLEFVITRAVIRLYTVSSKMLDDNIGYIKLKAFREPTAEELNNALDQILPKAKRGIIFDLRNNPGGLLSSAIQVASYFIQKGPVLYAEDRNGNRDQFDVIPNLYKVRVPVVVLVNEGSASASEIVAGALQDHKKATLVGTKTFGKGLVQSVIQLADGSAMSLTVQKWLTPKMRYIHKEGIKPDIQVEWDQKGIDIQLERAKEVLLGKK
ncbi:MAG: S41 family peptidase [bacterium]|nr:S41 family peptidase [bacterium]